MLDSVVEMTIFLILMMGLPDGRKSFKIGLVVLIQYRLTDRQTPSHVAVASARYAYLRHAVKTKLHYAIKDS